MNTSDKIIMKLDDLNREISELFSLLQIHMIVHYDTSLKYTPPSKQPPALNQ